MKANIMNKIIKIENKAGEDLPGVDNFSFADKAYTIPSGSKPDEIKQHINNAIGFVHHFKREITLIDTDNKVGLSICTNCTPEEILTKYQKLAKPDGIGRSASVTSLPTPQIFK